MTLLYSPLHDRTCTEHFIPIVRPSSASSNADRTYADSITRPRSAEDSSARKDSLSSTSNQHLYDVSDMGPRIIAPCPKKAHAGLRLLSAFGSIERGEKPFNKGRLEENERIIHNGLNDRRNDNNRVGCEKLMSEALAFAELKEIMSTSSRESSCPVSQSASPTYTNHPHAASPPPTTSGSECDNEEAPETGKYITSAIEIKYPHKAHITERNPFGSSKPTVLQRLTVDYSHLMFGSSPITRANNPLPLDESFSPIQQFSATSNPKRSSFTYMQKKLSTGDLNASYNNDILNMDKSGSVAENGGAQPFSKGAPRATAILLTLSEGGRRRSLSVGSASFKAASKPRSVC